MYATLATLWRSGAQVDIEALNPICKRDFVSPTTSGNCLCGEGEFCLCTPSLASDVIIELEDGNGTNVVFIERRDGRGLAMVGGFVRVGESAEAAAAREVKEETGLDITWLHQWCTFSAPNRDPRRHTAALVFIGRARGAPRAADDAKVCTGIHDILLVHLLTVPCLCRVCVSCHLRSYRATRRRLRSTMAAVRSSAPLCWPYPGAIYALHCSQSATKCAPTVVSAYIARWHPTGRKYNRHRSLMQKSGATTGHVDGACRGGLVAFPR